MINTMLLRLFGISDPQEYYLSTAGYYTFFEKYENFRFILNFLHSDNFRQAIKTDAIICFKGIVDFGMHQEKVKKLLPGKPAWIFQNSEINNHEVFFYKWKIGGYRTKAELHFLDECFFMGIYTFDNYPVSDYNKIKNLLLKKYQVTNDNLNAQTISIIDDHKNFILVRDIHGCSIIYFTGDREILQNLLEQETTVESKMKAKEEKKMNTIMASL
ncbi:MAG: hypothetical protein HY958_00255 [Bacteroidia bacterium]|nr:hypothetical protein [Bacteroidia bacterium]